MNDKSSTSMWALRRDVVITCIAWIALLAISLWALERISETIILIIIAAFLAYALLPLVILLQRFMPRTVAIAVVYLLVLTGFSFLVYFVVTAAIDQFVLLSRNSQTLLTVNTMTHVSPLMMTLNHFGISQSSINEVSRQLTYQAEGLTSSVVPILGSAFTLFLNTVITAVVSIYFLIDGEKVLNWIRDNMPNTQATRIRFFLNTLQRVVGGYIRGQVTLAILIGVLVGVGMTLLHVPYPILLGFLAFILEFIPIIGTIVSGTICILLALTQGWLIAGLTLAYVICIHIIESEVVGPRIVGKAVGLHPLVSIIAVVAGAELYGIVGIFLASPIAGVAQALLIALWTDWRNAHPQEFEKQKKKLSKQIKKI